MIRGELLAAARLRLRERLRERPEPLLLFPDATLPAASWWAGSRRWIEAGRDAGLAAGDPIFADLPVGPGLAILTVASLWEGWSLAVEPPPWPTRARVAAAFGPGHWATEDGLSPASLDPAPAESVAAWWLGERREMGSLYEALSLPNPQAARRWHGPVARGAFVYALILGLASETPLLGFGFPEADANGA